MVFLVLQIFLIVSTVIAEKSTFEKLQNKFDNYDTIEEMFSRLFAYVSKFYYPQPANLSSEYCRAFGQIDPTLIGSSYLEFNYYVESILNDVDTAILTVRDFEKIKNIIFKSVIKPLNEMDLMFAKYRELQTDPSTNSIAGIKLKIAEYLIHIFGEHKNLVKPNTALNNIFRHANPNINMKQPFLNFLMNYHGLNLQRCDKFDLVLDHLFFIYLRLVTTEIKGIIMVAQGCVLNTIMGMKDTNMEERFEEMIKMSLERIKSYMKQTNTFSIFNVSPKCRCGSPPLKKYNIEPYGEMNNFYQISEKNVTVYTNLSQHICIHLSNDPKAKGIMMLEICLGEDLNTEDNVRKNSEIIKTVEIKNPDRFKQPQVRKFNIDWSNGTLKVKYQETNRWINLITNVEVDQNDLDKISHYAVSSPHVHDRTFIWLLPHVPTLLPRFSPLITAARMCWCENILDDAQLTNFLKLNSTYVCPRFSYNVREYIKNLNSNGDLSLEDFCYDKSTIAVNANKPSLKYDSILVSGCTTR